MATEYYSDFLAHYGVAGQKWGVRRYQNLDGSYTAEGAMRYWGGTGQPRVRRAMPQPANTRRYGMASQTPQGTRMAQPQPQTQPQTAAAKNQNDQQVGDDYKRRELAKNLLIAAGAVALTAAAAYGAYKGYGYLRNNMDSVLRRGSSVHHIQYGKGDPFTRPTYVSTNDKDARLYRGFLGRDKMNDAETRRSFAAFNPQLANQLQDLSVNESTGRLNKSIRVAGDRTGRKVYEHLMKNDSEFRDAYSRVSANWDKSLDAGYDLENLYKKNPYKLFNRRLTDNTDDGHKVAQKFYDELAKRGYGSVHDLNDRDGMWGTRAKIIFDNKAVTQTKISELTNESINRDYDVASSAKVRDTIRRAKINVWGRRALLGAPVGAIFAGSGAYLGGINAQIRAHRSEINAYKREHPGTQKSDKEIYEMLYKRS